MAIQCIGATHPASRVTSWFGFIMWSASLSTLAGVAEEYECLPWEGNAICVRALPCLRH